MQKDILTDRSEESQDSTKNFLIIAAAKLFAKRGYYGTSIADITEACELTKSSYFHHFATKELIAFAVLDYLTELTSNHIFKPACDPTIDSEQHLKKLLSNIQQHILLQDKPLLGFLSIELINTSKDFAKRVRSYTDLWIKHLSEAIKPFHKNPLRIAHHSLAYLQGGVIIQDIYQKPELAEECCEHLLSLWTNKINAKIPSITS